MASSEIKKRSALSWILPFCSDSEMTGFAIETFNERDFPLDCTQTLLSLKQSQINNENEFQQRILKGERSDLPSQDPVIAIADSQKREMVQFSNAISDVQIDLVIDEENNEVKGYRFQFNDMSLDRWCQENGLPFEVYQAGLQAYIEVDVLKPMDVAIMNGQLVQMNPEGSGFDVISHDDLRKKMNANSNSWNDELEKRMRTDRLIEKDGKVRFSIESYAQKKQKRNIQKGQEPSKPAID